MSEPTVTREMAEIAWRHLWSQKRWAIEDVQEAIRLALTAALAVQAEHPDSVFRRVVYELAGKRPNVEAFEPEWPVDLFEVERRVESKPAPEHPDSVRLLPCDVRLPPHTTITAGCSIDTLMESLRQRQKMLDRGETISPFTLGGTNGK